MRWFVYISCEFVKRELRALIMTQSPVVISRAPGRVCLFGEHQDYLGLPVIAAAIDRHLEMQAWPNDRNELVLEMPDIGKRRIINITETFANLEKRDYLAAMLRVLRRYGCKPTHGLDITVRSNIPINAGASSSSAMTIAWGQLLLHYFGEDRAVSPERLSQFAYEAEVREHGEPGGMMDHYTIGCGGLLHIDTAEPFSVTPLPAKLDGLVLGDARAPKETLAVLSNIKRNVFLAEKIIKAQRREFSLQTTHPDELSKLSPLLPKTLQPFFIAAVQNHYYTRLALELFQSPQPDLQQIGTLMNQHHFELQHHLGITVPRIDRMIAIALSVGALGAKINGSGGGGTVVILAPGRQTAVIEALESIGVRGYSVNIDSGAAIIHSDN